ncbi:MAG TPA: hypothetical protein VNS46_04455 [Nocardioides sp.]|nr:hypothetical protein [Nocardioides sp.]
MRIPVARAVLVGTAVVLLLATGLVAVTALHHPPPHPPARTTPAAPAASVAPAARDVGVVRAVGSLAVLRDWDRARAAAWAAGDAEALGELYAPGSAAGRADVAMLRRWTARGLRVEGMTMQVLSVELRLRTGRRLVLVVTDRLVGAEAVAPGGRHVALPRDGATRRRLEFHRSGGRWLLASAVETAERVSPGGRS